MFPNLTSQTCQDMPHNGGTQIITTFPLKIKICNFRLLRHKVNSANLYFTQSILLFAYFPNLFYPDLSSLLRETTAEQNHQFLNDNSDKNALDLTIENKILI